MKVAGVSVFLSLVPWVVGVHLSLDVRGGAPSRDFPHFWKTCVGSGHMLLATRADWQKHMQRAKHELGFTGVRGHGILDDDMSVVTPSGYEFFNIDTVYDFLVEEGIRPVVELSFMPSRLVNCTGADCHYAFSDPGSYKGLVMPPSNYSEWSDLIFALGTHLVERYGIDEVSQWHFEVWNEMWGIEFPHPYLELYKASATALKAVSPRLRVGGPSTMQTLNVGDFVSAANAAQIPYDFVSTHLYPTDPECVPGDASCFASMIASAREYVRTGAPWAEFLITEYNAGLFLKEEVDLDSASTAAFIFRQLASVEDVDMFSWWTFTDIFEEQWMQATPFYGGYGLQTVNGVRKPAWRAFQLMGQAGKHRLPVQGAVAPADPTSFLSVLATKHDSDHVADIFLADWRPSQAKHFSCDATKAQCFEDPTGTYTDLNSCNGQCGQSNLSSEEHKQITVTISHHRHAKLHAKVALIDNQHANPKKLWIKWGRPQYPTKAQIQELHSASELVEEALETRRINATASEVTLKLHENSAARIRVEFKSQVVHV